MVSIFALCRKDDWHTLLLEVNENPIVATTSMIMDNHISTTILHQAITSKANTGDRTKVISAILERAPEAASIKNGYGSLPLHVISQRNTKMDSQTKEHLIHKLVQVYPDALVQEGGVGKRTPLHIAFTDYISPQLASMMIAAGKAATLKKDKKGWLPIHVAVSRHCSPEKLSMLLEANPSSLYATTNKGETLLTLAKTSATKSHPNYRLIAELEDRMDSTTGSNCDLLVKDDAKTMNAQELLHQYTTPPPQPRLVSRKRKAEAADLLLHFSRHEKKVSNTAGNNSVPMLAAATMVRQLHHAPAHEQKFGTVAGGTLCHVDQQHQLGAAVPPNYFQTAAPQPQPPLRAMFYQAHYYNNNHNAVKQQQQQPGYMVNHHYHHHRQQQQQPQFTIKEQEEYMMSRQAQFTAMEKEYTIHRPPQFTMKEQQEYMAHQQQQQSVFYPTQQMLYSSSVVGETAQV